MVRTAMLNLNALVQDMDRMLRGVMGEDVELVTILAPGLKTIQADPGQLEQVILNVAVNARDAMPNGGRLTLETANAQVTEEIERTQLPLAPGQYATLSINATGHRMNAPLL